jgi:hypothetical protein
MTGAGATDSAAVLTGGTGSWPHTWTPNSKLVLTASRTLDNLGLNLTVLLHLLLFPLHPPGQDHTSPAREEDARDRIRRTRRQKILLL